MGQYPIFTSITVAMFKIRVNHSTINPTLFLKGMAKSDSFFIRAKVNVGDVYADQPIDLGAYVDALGKSVLRIHRVSVKYPRIAPSAVPNAHTSMCEFQLTTQRQTIIVDLDDKSLIASGSLQVGYGVPSGAPSLAPPTCFNTDVDTSPDVFTNGYLVGVEQIYLAGQTANEADFGTTRTVEIMMECTVETLSQSGAMALALSQQ